MKSGLDVAQLWLDGEETLVYTTDRDKHIFPINMVDGHAITHDPLVILVSYRIFLLFSVVKKKFRCLYLMVTFSRFTALYVVIILYAKPSWLK